MSDFQIGDRVKWSSQAAGFTKEKVGVVAAVIQEGNRPCREQFADLYKGPGCGLGRPDRSYVVRVGRSKHYWPRTSALRPYEERRDD